MKETRTITIAAIGTGPGMKKMKMTTMAVTGTAAIEARMTMRTQGMKMRMKVTKMRTMIMDVEGAVAAAVEKEAALLAEQVIV